MTTSKSYQHQDTEGTQLLTPSTSPKKESKKYTSSVPMFQGLWRRVMDIGVGFVLCAILAVLMSYQKHQPNSNSYDQSPMPTPHQSHHGSTSSEDVHSHLRSGSDSSPKSTSSGHHTTYAADPVLSSQYTQFQAMGFQIYTAGAPALIIHESSSVAGDNKNTETPTMIHNPECVGLNSVGHFDDYDITNETLPASLWMCYLGEADPQVDVKRRLQVMTDAVERAFDVANDDPSILKIFIAPEFFWRGREGAYVFDVNRTQEQRDQHRLDDECTEVCQIMLGLEQLVAQKRFKDWLFLFGTVVVSETLPQEDEYDLLFYNFAPVYKGYDPEMEDHYGKRFLVPKRYVSNVDFLTPVRQYNGTITKELVDLTQQQLALARQKEEERQNDSSTPVEVTPTLEDEEDPQVVVQNPFELKRDFYDRDMWYAYKDELATLGYTMIEYDWLILDNITFTMEVCLDHDARTALNAYLADNVLGSPSRIPKNVRNWDPVAQKYVGDVDFVRIPRHQAQLSLVSSMGMTANPESLALTQHGTLILQDGQSSQTGTMSFESELDCDLKSWHFKGGSEFISRTAAITDTRINFQYQIHAPAQQVGVYKKEQWKDELKGIFTTTKYHPEITVYPIRDIAEV